MNDEQLIEYYRNLIEITKTNNTEDLEVGVEVSVEIAERLIMLIEKKQMLLTGLKMDYLMQRELNIPKLEEETLDIKRENYKLRKENFELIEDNNKLQTEKGMLREKLIETTLKLGRLEGKNG